MAKKTSFPSLLSLPFDDNLALAGVVAKGIPAAYLPGLASALGLAPSALAGLVNIAPRTLARRMEKNDLLKPAEAERTVRIGRLVKHATDVFGAAAPARAWFQRPLRNLGGRTPLELCATEPGAREVEQALGRIEHGVFA
jgi:putative toxin-antitoxin system antitoxin component (TIGR02293 family)